MKRAVDENKELGAQLAARQDKWADAVSNETMERGDDSLPPSPVRAKYGKGSNWVKERESRSDALIPYCTNAQCWEQKS